MIRDLSDTEARTALPLKWGTMSEGVIPAWVAEMDIAPPPAVTRALLDTVQGAAIGYPAEDPAPLETAYADFAERHWGWRPPAGSSVLTGGLMRGMQVVLEVLCDPGPVAVPMPCYPPFREVVAIARREVRPVVTDPDDPEGRIDLGGIERAFEEGARTLLLCNPHNPLGTVPTPAELTALAELAAAYGARVVSDEIHSPLTLPGAAFTPYLSVDPRGVSIVSHSKSFGTAGLHTAQILAPDEHDQQALRAVGELRNGGYSPLGLAAGIAAWTECDEWLAALLARLDGQRDLLATLLAEHLPLARHRRPEATYLAWVDLRAYGVDDPAAAALHHGVMLAPGHDYQPGLPGHVRINLATTPERLVEIVRRLAAALT